MTKEEKSLVKLYLKSGSVSFREIESALTICGYRLDRIKGSHHIFKKPGNPQINIPVHNNKVKKCYVKTISKTLFNTRNE